MLKLEIKNKCLIPIFIIMGFPSFLSLTHHFSVSSRLPNGYVKIAMVLAIGALSIIYSFLLV
jgi:hypothetical protein